MVGRIAALAAGIALLAAAPAAATGGAASRVASLQTYRADSGDLEVSLVPAADASSEFDVRVMRAGEATVERRIDGVPTGLHLVPVAGRRYPLVYVDVARGGARCCFAAYLLDGNAPADAIGTVRFGGVATSAMVPIGADGEYQIRTSVETGDAFGPAARRAAVPRMLAYRDGMIRDVTGEHADVVAADRLAQLAAFRSAATRATGPNADAALAAYLADSYVLGEAPEAWTTVRETYPGDVAGFEAKARRWLMDGGYTTP